MAGGVEAYKYPLILFNGYKLRAHLRAGNTIAPNREPGYLA